MTVGQVGGEGEAAVGFDQGPAAHAEVESGRLPGAVCEGSPLVVGEPVGGRIGEREVGRVGDLAITGGLEDHELESVLAAGGVAEMAGEVPPFGKVLVRGVVGREADGRKVGDGGGRGGDVGERGEIAGASGQSQG